MIVSDKIRKVTTSPDFLFWTSTVGKNGVCDAVRVSGFIIHEDGEHVSIILPEGFFKHIQPNLKSGSNISLLMVSIKNFESYQIKGNYIGHDDCTEENVDYFRLKVLKAMDIIDEMGMNGQCILGFLLEKPGIAVTMHCNEVFLQTPKIGTGTKLVD